ncbi:protein CROWDED NUCLEI 4-like [Actinidia eriantha]|uniref:protein CROWDED NUCLEI 4-like n=1 Tax=Actinidia eriantha TaxID=165200 RepID=UPI0025844F8A|nr:protein CROWDED NUCLEI 4-like [Actinidia eriantha]
MASPQSERLAITPTPISRVLRTPLGDEAIWKRIREAGFDEESIKRRDKTALIAYIAKIEAELYDHQYHMGLLILERKEWESKNEQIKASAESAELMYRRDKAAHASALAEAKKREENLKKALEIEKECVANIEKALHEMRAECAETKVAADSKLCEGRSMVENAEKKFAEAEAKLHAAKSLEAEASRYHRTAERKLHEVEAREDDLRRRISSFKTDCDAKEKEILLERQSLYERQKTLQELQDRLLDGQALLNKREDYIFSRSQELNRLEKELESSKANTEKDLRALNEERSNLELNVASLSAREEAVIKRECELVKREEELLILQEKLASKESDDIQHVMADHDASLRARKSEFEAELEMKQKMVEEEIVTKRRAWELREMDLRQREDLILEKEHDLEVQSRALADREKELTERTNFLDEKERSLQDAEGEVECTKTLLHKEKEETNNLKLDLQKSMDLLEERKKQVDQAEEKMGAMKSKTNELSVLEMRLKEEIDTIRAQKLELEVLADELKAEKAIFETEWELIDEKRVELRKEAERVADERLAISKFLKDERDCLKLERDAMRDQYKHDVESLSRDREAFMSEIEHERSEWFGKIQKEHADFLLDIEVQKRDLENCINKRREEIESYLMEKERAFEEEKKKELQHIASLRETVGNEMEQVNLEMQKLDAERGEIILDRERRDKEWAELNSSIEELMVQRQKLEKQRELLHVDREEILSQIEQMKKLEDLKAAPDCITPPEIQDSILLSRRQKMSSRRVLKQQAAVQEAKLISDSKIFGNGLDLSPSKGPDVSSPPVSAPFSWLKRCADTLLERTHSNKKRKQQKDADVPPLEETTNPCVSTQEHAPEDEHALMSLSQTLGGAEETTVYIDKIITIREVTSMDVGRVDEDSQYQHEVIYKESEERLEDHGSSRSVENGKAKQAVESTTRSKQL